MRIILATIIITLALVTPVMAKKDKWVRSQTKNLQLQVDEQYEMIMALKTLHEVQQKEIELLKKENLELKKQQELHFKLIQGLANQVPAQPKTLPVQ